MAQAYRVDYVSYSASARQGLTVQTVASILAWALGGTLIARFARLEQSLHATSELATNCFFLSAPGHWGDPSLKPSPFAYVLYTTLVPGQSFFLRGTTHPATVAPVRAPSTLVTRVGAALASDVPGPAFAPSGRQRPVQRSNLLECAPYVHSVRLARHTQAAIIAGRAHLQCIPT
jgi:hypothetical protein